MLQIVLVQIGVERRAGLVKLLVVFRAGQRRQEEELQEIDRQFALDDLDIAQQQFRRIGRETENVAGIGDGAGLFPHQHHLAIFGDAVLAFFRSAERGRIDALEADEHARHAGAAGLLDEIRQAMAQRIDLNQELDIHPFALTQLDQPVENLLPVLVAREIVVGDEEAVDALRDVGAHDRLDVVGGAAARDAALNVDDGAETALERTAAPGVETRDVAADLADLGLGQDRHRHLRDVWQVVHVIVKRLERAVVCVAQHALETPLGFAGEQRDAEIHRLLQFRLDARQHRQRARDMEAADRDLHAQLSQGAARHRTHADTGSTARRPDTPGPGRRRRCGRSSSAGFGYWSRRRRRCRSRHRRRARAARGNPAPSRSEPRACWMGWRNATIGSHSRHHRSVTA